MKNVVWTKGTSGLEGEFQSASEVDFYIDKVSVFIQVIPVHIKNKDTLLFNPYIKMILKC